eukprot:784967-Rhodomonas_salina.12
MLTLAIPRTQCSDFEKACASPKLMGSLSISCCAWCSALTKVIPLPGYCRGLAVKINLKLARYTREGATIPDAENWCFPQRWFAMPYPTLTSRCYQAPSDPVEDQTDPRLRVQYPLLPCVLALRFSVLTFTMPHQPRCLPSSAGPGYLPSSRPTHATCDVHY